MAGFYLKFSNPYYLFFLLFIIPIIIIRLKNRNRKLNIRDYFILFIRIILLILIVCVLSDLKLGKNIYKKSVVFIVDVSDSVKILSKNNFLNFINQTISKADKNTYFGLIVFGKNPMIELPVLKIKKINNITSVPESFETNIEKALDLAIEMFPEISVKKIVLISDGIENSGNFENKILKLQKNKITVDVKPIKNLINEECILNNILLPEQVKINEKFNVKINISNLSDKNKKGKLYVFKNNLIISQQNILINPGRNSLMFDQKIDKSGMYLYAAKLDVNSDKIIDNNKASALIKVIGKSNILLVNNDNINISSFKSILDEISNNNTVVISPSQFPNDLYELEKYDLIVFNNISVLDLDSNKLNVLKNYVQNFGGGLFVSGGNKSFGMGGYYATDLEKILPVRMDIKKSKFLPGCFLGLVIDKSGSMSGADYENSKIELAKKSASLTVDVLSPQDEVCIAAFDGAAKWLVRPILIGKNKNNIKETIGYLRAGGGTNLFPALKEVISAAMQSKKSTKHIIILSDGQTLAADFDLLTDIAQKNKITISTIAVGSDADRKFLEYLALDNKGRFYWTEDAEMLPQIFIKETFQISKNMILEDDFKAIKKSDDNILKNIDFINAPILKGYIRTELKQNILVKELLETHKKEPLLAYWNYGLGKTAVFTSDVFNKWGINWIQWKDFKPLFKQLCLKIKKKVNKGNIKIKINNFNNSDNPDFRVEIKDNKDNFLDNLNVNLNIVYPDGKSEKKHMLQVASGEYSVKFNYQKTGAYFFMVTADIGENIKISSSKTLIKSFSKEFLNLNTNYKNLKLITDLTNGIFNVKSSQINKKENVIFKKYSSYWRNLIILFIILLIFEVIFRRVYISFAVIWNKIKNRKKKKYKKIDNSKVLHELKQNVKIIKPEKNISDNQQFILSDLKEEGKVDKNNQKVEENNDELQKEDELYTSALLKIKKKK